jgi:hypothetical protein
VEVFGPNTTSRTLKYTEPVPVTLGVFEIFGAVVDVFVACEKAVFVLAISTLRVPFRIQIRGLEC